MDIAKLKTLAPSLEILYGNQTVVFGDLCSIDDLRPGALTFLGNAKIIKKINRFSGLKDFHTLGILIDRKVWPKVSQDFASDKWALVALVDSTEELIPRLSRHFYDLEHTRGNDLVDGRQMGTAEIHPTAWIGQNVFIGAKVKIHAHVTIHPGATILSGSEIGERTVIYPHVTVYRNVTIGRNCRIHSSTVIGADGFGYNFLQGQHHKIWHFGGVQIGDEVEIGACSAVDSGTFSATIIGPGTKLDNHVQIGHNCRVGRGVILCGHSALGGSCIIGDFCVFGGKSGMGHGIELGSACQIAGGALVNCDWPAGSVLGGHPARPLKEWMKGLAYLRNVSLKERG